MIKHLIDNHLGKCLIGLFILFGVIAGPKHSTSAPSAQAQAKQKDYTQSNQDNAIAIAHQVLMSKLNDPDSVEWEGSYVFDNLDVCIDFTAKNAMGGRVKGFATMTATGMRINDLKQWNKTCGKGGSVRYY